MRRIASLHVALHVYGAGGLLYGEYDGNGDLIREYVWLDQKEPLAQIDDDGSTEVLTRLYADHLGMPIYGTDALGYTNWSLVTDAFGNGTPTGTAEVNLRFPGQYWDAESGLHYNWNRYYDPETGRYISSDPIGLAGGLNTFGYALQNPAIYIDPRGLNVDITISRETFTDISITSSLSVSSDVIPDTFEGYALEDRIGGSCQCKDPIAEGSYDAFVRTTGKNGWRIELVGVPNYSNVQIHAGNSAGDVEGCFAAGTSTSTNYVSASRAAMNKIREIVEKDGGDITVHVIGDAGRTKNTGLPPIPKRKPF